METTAKINLHRLAYIHSPVAENVLYFIYMHEYPDLDAQTIDNETVLNKTYERIELLSGLLSELIEEGKVIKDGDCVFDPAVNILETKLLEHYTN